MKEQADLAIAFGLMNANNRVAISFRAALAALAEALSIAPISVSAIG
jgi:hypothetical protein